MSRTIDLDHVALAGHDIQPTLNVLVGDLGARVLFGGANFGFRAMQVDAGDMRIELLEPWNVEDNDFLKRFLETTGEGPHHLTFKTDDIRRDLVDVREAGYHPVGVNIDNPFWQEAFLHPKEAGGTVVQIAQSEMDPMEIDVSQLPEEVRDRGPHQWWQTTRPPAADRATLRRVVLTTGEMQRALDLYATLLCGDTAGYGEGWVELAWPTGGRIRVEAAAGRQEGITRLEWTHAGPAHTLLVGGTTFAIYSDGA